MKTICICFLLLVSSLSIGQVNLVPNPSFEDYNNCPSMLANLSDCATWQNFGETPDYFNTCGINCLQVPVELLPLSGQKS